jgi:NAD(P)-dependent dehydrogenase (short-subunit alcohol dehydrogenase family)
VADAARFAGKVALVTGGSQGIGRAVSSTLAEGGATVAIAYRSDQAAAEAMRAELDSLGARALLVRADISETDDLERLVTTTIGELGGVDLLVNNAAYSRVQDPHELTLRTWRSMFRTNVESAFHLTWMLKDQMRERGGGSVVNISSSAGTRPDASTVAYGTSKAALDAFTQRAALALAPYDIRVNAVAPGHTATPRANTIDAETREAFRASVPLGRIADPAEMAAVVAFLLSDDASYVTGQIVTAAADSEAAMGIRQIYLAGRNPAIAPEDFPERWRAHAELASRFPQLASHFQSSVYALGIEQWGGSSTFDAIGVLRLPGLASARAIVQDPDAVATVQPDELRVFDGAIAGRSMFAEEHPVIPRQAGRRVGGGLLSFFRRQPGGTESFHECAAQVAERARPAPGLVSFTHDIVVPGPWPSQYAFDAVHELWFDSVESASSFHDTHQAPPPGADPSGSVVVLTSVTMWWDPASTSHQSSPTRGTP